MTLVLHPYSVVENSTKRAYLKHLSSRQEVTGTMAIFKLAQRG